MDGWGILAVQSKKKTLSIEFGAKGGVQDFSTGQAGGRYSLMLALVVCSNPPFAALGRKNYFYIL